MRENHGKSSFLALPSITPHAIFHGKAEARGISLGTQTKDEIEDRGEGRLSKTMVQFLLLW